MIKFIRLVAVFMSLLLLSSCKMDLVGPLDFRSAPFSSVQVYVRNSTLNEFSTNWSAYPVPVGAQGHILGHLSSMPNLSNPNSFDISRESHPLARVTYRVLRYPTLPDGWQEVIINITEASPGVFGAATPDSTSTWIQVLAVQSL